MIQRVSPIAPVHWFVKALNIGAGHRRLLFGSAVLIVSTMMAALALLGIVFGLGMGATNDPTPVALDPQKISAVAWVVLLLAASVPQFVIAGVSWVMHGIETGRPTRITDVFAGFRGGRALSLLALVAMPVAAGMLNLLAQQVFGGADYVQQYFAAMQQVFSGKPPAPLQPEHPALLLLSAMAIAWVNYTLQLLVPQHVMLARRGALGALLDVLRAFLVNFPAMCVAGVFGFALLIVVVMTTSVGMLLLIAITQAVPALGMLLMMVTMLGLGVIGVLLMVGWGYYAWRDMLGDSSETTDRAGNDRVAV